MTTPEFELPAEYKAMALALLKNSPEVKDFLRSLMVEFFTPMMEPVQKALEESMTETADKTYKKHAAALMKALKEGITDAAKNGSMASGQPAQQGAPPQSGGQEAMGAVNQFLSLLKGGSSGSMEGFAAQAEQWAKTFAAMATAFTASPMEYYQRGGRDTAYAIGMWGKLSDDDKARLTPMLVAPGQQVSSQASTQSRAEVTPRSVAKQLL